MTLVVAKKGEDGVWTLFADRYATRDSVLAYETRKLYEGDGWYAALIGDSRPGSAFIEQLSKGDKLIKASKAVTLADSEEFEALVVMGGRLFVVEAGGAVDEVHPDTDMVFAGTGGDAARIVAEYADTLQLVYGDEVAIPTLDVALLFVSVSVVLPTVGCSYDELRCG